MRCEQPTDRWGAVGHVCEDCATGYRQTDPFRNGEVQIRVRLPGKTEEARAAVTLDANVFRDFQPLPRDREIIFEGMVEGRRQEESRRKLAAHIANMLVQHLMGVIEADDTVNGYTKEENRKFYEGI